MLLKYTDLYKKGNKQQKLDILKRYLVLMFPLYDFSPVDDFNVIYARGKIQFYVKGQCICALVTSKYVAELYIYSPNHENAEVCLDINYNSIMYELIEMGDVL